jgi:hypothetical protein
LFAVSNATTAGSGVGSSLTGSTKKLRIGVFMARAGGKEKEKKEEFCL